MSMSEIRKKTIAGLNRGDCFVVSRTFTQEGATAFADMSHDYNPVHFDHRFAELKKFRAPICHGLQVASLLTEIGGQIGWLASEMNFRFKKPVYFGDTIQCRFTITELDDRNRARGRSGVQQPARRNCPRGIRTGDSPWLSRKACDASYDGRGRSDPST